MCLRCSSISVSQWRLMLLWSHKNKPDPSSLQRDKRRNRGQKPTEKASGLESNFLGLVYSVLAGSELLIVNQAEGLIQRKVPG